MFFKTQNSKPTKQIKLIFLVLLVGASSSCGLLEQKGKSGKARIAMSNGTSSLWSDESLGLDTSASNELPDYYGLKLVGVSIRYVDNPADSNSPPVYESGIYVAPVGCTNGGKSETKKDDKIYEYYQPPGPSACDPSAMEYVDFAQSSEDVNAAINAGEYPIVPGVYNKVTVCFSSVIGVSIADHIPDVIDFDTAGETTSSSGCVDKDINIDVKEGDTVLVSLDYDLASAVTMATGAETGAGEEAGCVDSESEDGTYFCLAGLNPVPTATKQ